MSRISIKLTPKEWGYLAKDIREWYQVSLTSRQMKKLVSKDKRLLLEVAFSIGRDGCDTGAREQVAGAIAGELTGQDWPTYADYNRMGKKKAKEFYSKLIRNAHRAGYKTLDNAEDYMG